MSEYEQLLARGREQLAEKLEAARRRTQLSKNCNGRISCRASFHLVCCKRYNGRAQFEPFEPAPKPQTLPRLGKEQRAQMLSLIGEKPTRLYELRDQLGIDNPRAYYLIHELCKAGQVERVSHGVYRKLDVA